MTDFEAAIAHARQALDSLGGTPSRPYIRRKRCSKSNKYPQKCVYVIGFDEYVKIGRTTKLKLRLSTLQIAMPIKLTIYSTIAGQGTELERRLHKRFDAYRLNGEWFQLKGTLATWINGGCVI